MRGHALSVNHSQRIAFYASAGPTLTHYSLDVTTASLTRHESVQLPTNVQYIWPHASRRFIYVASSSRAAHTLAGAGENSYLSAFRVDPASGALSPHGAPVELFSRPIHLTTDLPSAHILTAYNDPSSLTVHRIESDGTIGGEVDRVMPPAAGIYAHQVRMMPSGRAAIIVARGNDKTRDKPEDPGVLNVFAYADGRLTPKASIAPNGGYGFGPRHIDFHPTRPWLYASLERQNALAMFRMRGDDIDPAPSFTSGTLINPQSAGPKQIACTIHAHPNGRFVYVPNRAYSSHTEGGVAIADGGENNLAVFAIDMASGEPTRIQNIELQGFGARTFSIDPSGRLLVAGNLISLTVREGGGIRTVPASIVLFRIGDDGRLEFVRKVDVDTDGHTQFWTGMLELPAE
jgi:6-phosphogluconolactonase